MSDTYRSDPKRAAELGAVLMACAMHDGAAPPVERIGNTVARMQKAARSAARWEEHVLNNRTAEEERAKGERRLAREAASINAQLAEIAPSTPPTIELGGDARGPCARLHIPGQRGDGWGDGFAVY